MADTGEDREIKQRANANEAEVIRESKELLRKTKEALTHRRRKHQVQGRFIGASKQANNRMVR